MTSYLYVVKVDAGAYRLELNKLSKSEPKELLYKDLTKSIHDKTCVAAFKCLYGVSAYADLLKVFIARYTKHTTKDAFMCNELDMSMEIISYMQKRGDKKSKETAKETAKEGEVGEVDEPGDTSETVQHTVKDILNIDLLTNS